jgi:hypothetical protein
VAFFEGADFLNVAAPCTHAMQLFESPVYFEAYAHVLSCLQQTRDLPFRDNLVSILRVSVSCVKLTPSQLAGNCGIELTICFFLNFLQFERNGISPF